MHAEKLYDVMERVCIYTRRTRTRATRATRLPRHFASRDATATQTHAYSCCCHATHRVRDTRTHASTSDVPCALCCTASAVAAVAVVVCVRACLLCAASLRVCTHVCAAAHRVTCLSMLRTDLLTRTYTKTHAHTQKRTHTHTHTCQNTNVYKRITF